ncbi:MAG: lysophospholipid acyltransferase family protein [candidate division Zixibacteria bacterium]
MANKLKNNIVFFSARILFWLINFLPRFITLFLGELLGMIAYCLIKKERHKTLLNLDRAYGNSLSYHRKKEIARLCFQTFGRAALEDMRMRRYYQTQMRPNIEIVGEENLKKAYQKGKGIVAFTGHIGNFELLAAWVAQSGYKAAVIGRELYDKRLDEMLIANRTAMDIVNIRTDDSPRDILRFLKDNYAIGFLIDTDSFRVGGELTPFFGRLAKTPIGPTQLGLVSGAAFLPIFCLSFPRGKYKIVIGEELTIESRERTRENIYKITGRMTKEIEKIIRRHPDQWIWMHNRWHTRPEVNDLEFLRSLKG